MSKYVSSVYRDREARVCAPYYKPIPAVIERAEGVWMWDVEGKKYLDMMSAYSAVSQGHLHPRIIKVIEEQMRVLTLTSRAFHTDKLGAFLQKMCDISGMEMAAPLNTGAEAVELAIKAARRWGYHTKGIKHNEAEIIVANNNFHGRTTTIISFSTEREYRYQFGPFTPGFKAIPFGDADALEAVITPNTCAFLVEPIQGEAGIIVPPEGWLKRVREICTKNNVLLILDEIQSGLGRTGKCFAFQHEGIEPDGLILGKALGGGFLPVSAFLSSREVMELMGPGSHGSTFGGNPLAAVVGLEAINIVLDEKLAERSATEGAYFLEKLRAIDSPLIKEVRGRGLWIGMEIQHVTARAVCERLMEKGLLSKETHETVVRFAPPLVIERKELDWALEQVETTLKELEG